MYLFKFEVSCSSSLPFNQEDPINSYVFIVILNEDVREFQHVMNSSCRIKVFEDEACSLYQGVKSSYIPIFFLYFQEMAIFPIFDQNVLYFLYFNENNKKFFQLNNLMHELCLNCKKTSY